MLGSLVEDSEEGWQTGLAGYRTVAPLTDEEAALAHVLDRTGVVVGAVSRSAGDSTTWRG